MRKRINIIAYVVLAAMVLSIIVLSATGRNRHNRLKAANKEIELLQRSNDSLFDLASRLAKLDAVRCEVTINVKSTAVMGKSEVGAVNTDAKQVATYLREELLKEVENGVIR